MRTAIIGLPMAGKTSLFTILTGAHQAAHLGAMAVRVGVAKVPDPRLETVAEVFRPGKVTHATIEYVDTPAISKEALRDPAFLAGLRLVDAFAHVLRLFEDERVPHEMGSIDPRRDLEHIEVELHLRDRIMVEKRLDRLEKDRRKIKSAELDREFELLEKCKALLDANRPLRELALSEEGDKRIRGFGFLSRKPALCVLNLGEADAPRLHAIETKYHAGAAICGKIEAELAELSPEEAGEYLASFGLAEPGLERVVAATYSLLGLICFFTGSDTEVRAWTVPKDTPALKAAGAIHTDFEQKFIRAEVINWKALVDSGSIAHAREKGLLRLEGKDYLVKDGDVLQIRHT